MKKLLAAFVAATITITGGLTNLFAASTNARFEFAFTSASVGASAIPRGDATLTLTTSDGDTLEFESKTALAAGAGSLDIQNAFAGAEAEFSNGGILYTAKLTGKGLSSGQGALYATLSPAGYVDFTLSSGYFSGPNGTSDFNNSSVTNLYTNTPGTGGVNDLSGQTIDIGQVLYSDSSGTAIPLVEDKDDLNGEGDGVVSGTDVYFLINEPFDNDTYFKLRATKGSNSKNIDSIEVVSKYFSSELYKVYGGAQLSGGVTTGRHSYVKVSLKELYTDDEYKITFDLKVSLTSSGQDRYPDFEETSIKADDVTAIWLKNKVEDGDGDYSVGESGMVIKPLENDWNEITWYNEAGDLAHLTFFADSDVDAFYSKLSTKWEHADYASYFNDQDAYIFNFTGSPQLSTTSRADLEIFNPFVDEDGEEQVDPETITIYQVIDGDLYDVTDSWTYQENDDGDMVYATRTRFLGTYIFCEKPVEEASDEVIDAEDYTGDDDYDYLTPDTSTETGGKVPPNTGRYL